jgi:hypothetical protein
MMGAMTPGVSRERMDLRLGLGAAQSWSPEEAIAAWGRNMAVFSLGSNSRVRGKAAADLGWSPTQRSVTRWITNELV